MSRTGVRCFACLAAALALICAFWTANAYAASSGPSISDEFWVGLFCTVLFALIGAYVKGLEKGFDKRLTSLEHEAKQQATLISLLRADLAEKHPTKTETSEHRAHVEEQLTYLRDRIDTLVDTITNRRR